MAAIETGTSTAGKANVDSVFALKTNTSNHNTEASNVGSTVFVVEHDPGTYTGVRELASPSVTENGALLTAPQMLQWHGMFPGAAQNTGTWKHLFTTMTATQSGDGMILLNANNTATTTTGCSMQTWKYFSFFDVSTFAGVFQLSINSSQPQANQILEWGFFVPTATGAPADGVYLRYSNAGLYGYIKYGSNAEVASAILGAAGSIVLNDTFDFQIIVDERVVHFHKAGVKLGSINIPSAQSNVFQNLGIPLAFQQRNTGAVVGTQMQAKFSCTSVYQNDLSTNEDWFSQLAGLGNAGRGLDGGTMGKTALWVNNGVPTAVALTNTTAAFTGMSGIVAVLPTLAVGTDGILINYTNPAGSTTQPAKVIYVFGVSLSGVASVALTGGAVAYCCAVAYGHNAVSLATTDSASFANNTTKSPTIMPIGTMTFPVTAAVGAQSGIVPVQFIVPLVVNPGENVSIILRNVGVVTTLGAITMTAGFDHVSR